MPMQTRHSGPSQTGDPVRYIDSTALNRPLDMPQKVRLALIAFMAAAALIGAVLAYQAIDKAVGGPARAAASVKENVGRPVDLALPQMLTAGYLTMDDEALKAALGEAGYTIIDNTPEEMAVAGMGVDLIKLPEGVDAVEAGLMYANGVSNLGAADAARLLNGSWRLALDRSGGGIDLHIRYADFASGNVDAAVQNAIAAEGLADTEFGDSGIDGSGNTYQAGTLDDGERAYSWQVSACPLSGVSSYSVDGLPEDAVYVGIRITA